MKLVNKFNDYVADGREQKAILINEFLDKFWHNLRFEAIDLRKYYYEINNALASAIENNVDILGAQYTADYKPEHEEHIRAEARYRLSRIIAAEIERSDKFPMKEWDDFNLRQRIYNTTIPFIMFKEKKNE